MYRICVNRLLDSKNGQSDSFKPDKLGFMVRRIMEIMRSKGFNSSRFAEEIGIQRAAMSHILNGRNNVSLDVYKKILEKFPDISSDWLLFGKGEMKRAGMDADVPNTLFPISKVEQAPDAPSAGLQEVPEPLRRSVHAKTPSHSGNKTLHVENLVEPIIARQKKIDKIIIFYSDHTFETFLSGKEKIE